MKSKNADALVARFVEIGVEQEQAQVDDDIALVNRLYDENAAILEELKSRAGDQRRRLLSLLDHENIKVRLNAAKATLAVEPDVARRALQAIADSGEFLHAGDAGMSLWALDEGIFRPT